jgi:hypothetical protein
MAPRIERRPFPTRVSSRLRGFRRHRTYISAASPTSSRRSWNGFTIGVRSGTFRRSTRLSYMLQGSAKDSPALATFVSMDMLTRSLSGRGPMSKRPQRGSGKPSARNARNGASGVGEAEHDHVSGGPLVAARAGGVTRARRQMRTAVAAPCRAPDCGSDCRGTSRPLSNSRR